MVSCFVVTKWRGRQDLKVKIFWREQAGYRTLNLSQTKHSLAHDSFPKKVTCAQNQYQTFGEQTFVQYYGSHETYYLCMQGPRDCAHLTQS